MQIHTHNNRRIIQHTDNHYDIEEYRPVLDELFGYVWAVIYCSEDEMETTFKKVTLITRRDEQGVESFYNENEGIWYNDYGHEETENFIRKYVFPTVIIARFGGWNGVELTGDQWRDLQCPIRMTQEQLDAVLANQPAAVEAWQAERMNDPFRDDRLDPQLNCHNIAVDVAAYNVLHAVPANKEWAEKRLMEETEKRTKYLGGDTDKI